jgi:hypothetical protein
VSNRESLRNWGIIIAVLILSGILTVAWPLLMGDPSGASPTQIPRTMETVTINLPVPIAGMSSITLNSLQIMLLMGTLAGGLVVGTGIAIALGNVIISRLVTNTAKSEAYLARKESLDKREAEQIKSLRDERQTGRASPERWRRWSVISTGLVFVIFAIFAGYLIAYTFFPEGFVVRGSNIIEVASIIIGAAVLLTLLVLALRLRLSRLEAIETAPTSAVPWDFIAVVLTGILVVGLGIGFMIFINSGSGG